MEDELKISERALEFGVSSSGDIVHAVAEHHAQSVGALFQKRGDIISGVFAGLAVVGPARFEFVIAHLGAIESQLMKTESGDIRGGTPHGFGDGELASQQRERFAGDGRFASGGHAVYPQYPGRFPGGVIKGDTLDRKSTRLNSSHRCISY